MASRAANRFDRIHRALVAAAKSKARPWLLTAVVLAFGAAPTASAQDPLYRETFGRPDPATGNIATQLFDWQRFNLAGAPVTGNSGVSSDGTGKPIDLANTESAGTVVGGTLGPFAEGWHYMDNGTGVQHLTMTTEFVFDPAASAPVAFSWWQGAAYNGTPNINEARLAVRVGGAWYVSSEAFTNTPVTAGANFGSTDPLVAQGAELKSLVYDPAAANWITLNFDGDYDPVTDTGTASTLGAIAMGAPAAGPLVGSITAFGLYRAVAGANMRFDNFTIEGNLVHPGDTDADGDVDMNDFTPIQNHFQQSVTMRSQGDLNGDGMVDWLDFRQWKSNHPFTPPPAESSGSAVPEPAAAMLALVAAAARGCRPNGAEIRSRRLVYKSRRIF
jgi:hypothetical protein